MEENSDTSVGDVIGERDTLRSVQLRTADIYIILYINTMAKCHSGRKCIAVK